MLFSLSLFLSFLHLYRILSFYRHPNIHCYYKYLQSAGKVGWGLRARFDEPLAYWKSLLRYSQPNFFSHWWFLIPLEKKRWGSFEIVLLLFLSVEMRCRTQLLLLENDARACEQSRAHHPPMFHHPKIRNFSSRK